MKAEIIAVGTELLLGNILNTNAQFLSIELAELGYDMYYQTVVGDNFNRLEEQIKQSAMRSDVVIITGGLGPTPDDLSKEAAASALNLELSLDNDSLKAIESYYKSVNRKMSDSNLKQAYFPTKNCTIIPNKNGTAPGCILTSENGSLVILMPGVPNEMKKMFSGFVKPYLAKLSYKTIVSKNVLVAGIGESLLVSKIEKFINMADPTVSPYCKPGLVNLRVTAAGSTFEAASKKSDSTVNELLKILGKNVCGVDVDSIEQAVVELLLTKKLKLATAESCTAGLVSSRITAIPGASAVFDFGASTYSNGYKHKLLKVNKNTIKAYGAVSAETACQMAIGIRKYAKSDIGLSITGVAGPGQSEAKPAGLVFIALSDKNNVWVEKLIVGNAENNREMVRNTAATVALDLIRRYLMYYPNVMPGATNKNSPSVLIPEEIALNETNLQL